MKDIRSLGPNVGSVGGLNQGRGVDPRGSVDANLFKEALEKAKPSVASTTAGASPLKFSNHAVDRMQSRGIHFSPDEMVKIGQAVQKAQAKGAKDCLLLADKAALIVSLKDNTVVTVMDKANLKENVFTNIDSTVVL